MFCTVYSSFSEADLLPSKSLQLSKRDRTERQLGKSVMDYLKMAISKGCSELELQLDGCVKISCIFQ